MAGYLFALPEDFFDELSCISNGPATETANPTAFNRDEEDAEDHAAGSSTPSAGWSEGMGATCIACGIGINSQGFTSSAEQRQHFKTDWHRYNVKRRLEKKPPLTEAAFEAMIEQQDDVSSISGSDTDESSSESDLSDDESGGLQGSAGRKAPRGQKGAAAVVQGAQVVFRTQGGDAFAVWRCLLLPDSQKQRQEEHTQQQLLQRLKQLRASAEPGCGDSSSSAAAGQAAAASSAAAAAAADAGPDGAAGCIWATFMLRGGHFAGAVVRMNSSSSSSSRGSSSRQAVQHLPGAAGQPGSGTAASEAGQSSQAGSRQRPDRSQQLPGLAPGAEPFTVLAHKTFHRYVVRAKAGGKQSTKDATGKFARSAGSRLRRYNEAALSRDITQLIKEWSQHLAAAQLIFVAAPGSNSRVLFDAAAEAAPPTRQGSAGPLDPADPRVRRVPFVTQRPTFSELKRVLWVLGSVRKLALSEATEQQGAAAATTSSSSQDAADQQQQQQEQQQEASAAAAAAASAAAAAAAAVSSPLPPVKKQEDAALVKASKAGDAERVSRLLANGHDPTVRDAKGRSPYQLAANKEVRDAFRRYMAAAPTAWDYSISDIPSPLTDEMEAAQQSKKADKRARQRAKDKERKDGKAAAGGGGSGSSSKAGPAAAAGGGGGGGGGDSFDDELAAAMAEAAAISSRASASSKPKQVGGSSSSSGRRGTAGASSSAAAAAARAPSAEEVSRRREQLAAAAEARLKALQQKQQLW